MTQELTAREQSVHDYMIMGRTSKEIAGHLGISPRTVEQYRANILAKLGARNTIELMRWKIEGNAA